MLHISHFENTIATFVDNFFPTFSHKRLGLHFVAKFEYEDMGYDKSGNGNKVREHWKKCYRIEMLFQRQSNYTKVLGRLIPEDEESILHYTTKEPITLKQYSFHDSCWRDEGFREFLKTFIDAINSYKEDTGLNLHENLNAYIGLDIFNSPCFVEIDSMEMTNTKDRWNTDYKVKIKRRLTTKGAAKFMPED